MQIFLTNFGKNYTIVQNQFLPVLKILARLTVSKFSNIGKKLEMDFVNFLSIFEHLAKLIGQIFGKFNIESGRFFAVFKILAG